jgi:hypothetical protein
MELDALGFAFSGVLDQHTGTDGQVLYYDAIFMKPARSGGS